MLNHHLKLVRKVLHQSPCFCSFVPLHEPCTDESTKLIQEFVDRSKNIFVLTGAGISTESGIPDYRSEGVGLYATSSRRPVQYKVCCIII